MDMKRLQYFVAVGEELNLRLAAQRLGLSQPALSLQLTALERELGLDLVIRDRQRIVALSEAGQKYLAEARRLLSEVDAAAYAARAVAAGKQRVIRLGLCEEICSPQSLRVIRRFRESLPQVLFHYTELTADLVSESLERGDTDAVLLSAPFASPGVELVPLWEEPWLAAVPEQHALAHRALLQATDFHDLELILRRAPLNGEEPVRATLLHEHVTPRIALTALRRSTMLTAAMAQLGITFLPRSLAALTLPGLKLIPVQCEPMSVVLAYNASTGASLADELTTLARLELASLA
ncbi:MAG: LysR family transcriptional regulator [Steroidobacteraceae bacterium]